MIGQIPEYLLRSAAEDFSNGYDNNVNQLQNKEGDNDFDDGKYVTKNHEIWTFSFVATAKEVA
jgi:hypothetical protein